jgi:ribulose-5-phosphate 4-epimerase/fuculose-1-phosphate aldolase
MNAPEPRSRGRVAAEQLADLAAASRILAAQGVVDGFGHVSMRHPGAPDRYLMARSLAPALVTPDDILEYDLDSNAIGAKGQALYNERFIHGEIYKARPDVKAIVHNHSPSVVPFACTGTELKPIFHMSAFIGLGVPSWDIRDAQEGTDMLVKTPYLGEHLARCLGKHPAVLMRGHGSTVVAENIQRAVGRTIYLEMNARMQFQATVLAGPEGRILFMDDAEVAANVSWQNYERSWNLWKTRALAKLASEKGASR